MPSKQEPTRAIWMLIVYSFVASALLLAAVGHLSASTARLSLDALQTIRPVFYVISAVSLLAALAVIQLFLRRPAESGSLLPQVFVSRSIIVCAIAEISAISGLTYYFVGGSLGELWALTAGTVIADVLFLVPVGMAYWAQRE